VEKLDPKRIGKITARSIYDAAGWPAIEVELTMDNGGKSEGLLQPHSTYSHTYAVSV